MHQVLLYVHRLSSSCWTHKQQGPLVLNTYIHQVCVPTNNRVLSCLMYKFTSYTHQYLRHCNLHMCRKLCETQHISIQWNYILYSLKFIHSLFSNSFESHTKNALKIYWRVWSFRFAQSDCAKYRILLNVCEKKYYKSLN